MKRARSTQSIEPQAAIKSKRPPRNGSASAADAR